MRDEGRWLGVGSHLVKREDGEQQAHVRPRHIAVCMCVLLFVFVVCICLCVRACVCVTAEGAATRRPRRAPEWSGPPTDEADYNHRTRLDSRSMITVCSGCKLLDSKLQDLFSIVSYSILLFWLQL